MSLFILNIRYNLKNMHSINTGCKVPVHMKIKTSWIIKSPETIIIQSSSISVLNTQDYMIKHYHLTLLTQLTSNTLILVLDDNPITIIMHI